MDSLIKYVFEPFTSFDTIFTPYQNNTLPFCNTNNSTYDLLMRIMVTDIMMKIVSLIIVFSLRICYICNVKLSITSKILIGQ